MNSVTDAQVLGTLDSRHMHQERGAGDPSDQRGDRGAVLGAMIKSPSYAPGTERSPASCDRSLIINTSPTNLEDFLAIDPLGLRRSLPVRRQLTSFRESPPRNGLLQFSADQAGTPSPVKHCVDVGLQLREPCSLSHAWSLPPVPGLLLLVVRAVLSRRIPVPAQFTADGGRGSAQPGGYRAQALPDTMPICNGDPLVLG